MESQVRQYYAAENGKVREQGFRGDGVGGLALASRAVLFRLGRTRCGCAVRSAWLSSGSIVVPVGLDPVALNRGLATDQRAKVDD